MFQKINLLNHPDMTTGGLTEKYKNVAKEITNEYILAININSTQSSSRTSHSKLLFYFYI